VLPVWTPEVEGLAASARGYMLGPPLMMLALIERHIRGQRPEPAPAGFLESGRGHWGGPVPRAANPRIRHPGFFSRGRAA
jgi:hypothetical protein